MKTGTVQESGEFTHVARVASMQCRHAWNAESDSIDRTCWNLLLHVPWPMGEAQEAMTTLCTARAHSIPYEATILPTITIPPQPPHWREPHRMRRRTTRWNCPHGIDVVQPEMTSWVGLPSLRDPLGRGKQIHNRFSRPNLILFERPLVHSRCKMLVCWWRQCLGRSYALLHHGLAGFSYSGTKVEAVGHAGGPARCRLI